MAAGSSPRPVEVAAHPVAVFGVAHLVANGFLGRAGLVRVAVESAAGRSHHSLPQLGPADGIVGARPGRIRDGRDQQLRVRVGRVGQEIQGLALFNELSGEHDRRPVRQVSGRGEVVCDVEHGDSLLIAEFAHQVQHADPDRNIQHGGGFVGEDDPWFHGKGPGNRDSLALPAGELVRVGVQHVGLQAHGGHELLEPLLRLCLGAAALPVDRQRPPQEVLHSVGRIQRAEGILEDHLQLGAEGSRCLEAVALEDVDAVDQDLAGARLFQPGNAAGQGALTRTGLSHECHDFAAANGQVHAVQGPDGVPGEQTTYRERLS